MLDIDSLRLTVEELGFQDSVWQGYAAEVAAEAQLKKALWGLLDFMEIDAENKNSDWLVSDTKEALEAAGIARPEEN